MAITTDPLHILHLTAGSDAGGISRYLVDLGVAMSAQGHDVAVAGERGADHARFEAAGLRWIDCPLKGGPAALWRAARQLERWIESEGGWRPDVLHVHYRKPALVARRLGRRLDIPVLFTLHLSDLPLGGPWRWLSDFGDVTHAPSAEAARWLVEVARVEASRVVTIPHGVNPARFPRASADDRRAAREALGLPGDATVAAYVGRFDEPKNEGWVVDVAAATRGGATRGGAGVRFILLGGGPREAALRRRVEDEGLRERVRVLPYRDPLAVYRACDVLLMPSGREGFSLVCAEAMSVGRAVLRTRTAGAAETTVDGVTGRAVPIDRDTFVAAAVEMLSDPEALHTMGDAGAAHVRQHLTFERQVAETVELYRRMRAGSPE